MVNEAKKSSWRFKCPVNQKISRQSQKVGRKLATKTDQKWWFQPTTGANQQDVEKTSAWV